MKCQESEFAPHRIKARLHLGNFLSGHTHIFQNADGVCNALCFALVEEVLAEGLVTLVSDDFRSVHLDCLALVGPLPEKVRKRLLDEIPPLGSILVLEQIRRRLAEGDGELLHVPNILHRRQGDKGDRRNILQIHVVDGIAHVQILYLEGEADVVVELGIAGITLLGKRVPAFFTVVDDEGHDGHVLLAFQKEVVVVFRNLRHDFGILVGLMFGDDAHVEARHAAFPDVRLEHEVGGARVLRGGVVLASPAKAAQVDGIEESLERGIVAREQCQEFGHSLGFGESESKVAIMDKVALAFIHRIDDGVEFVGNVAKDRIDNLFCIEVVFVFRHVDVLSAKYGREKDRRTPPIYYIKRFRGENEPNDYFFFYIFRIKTNKRIYYAETSFAQDYGRP